MNLRRLFRFHLLTIFFAQLLVALVLCAFTWFGIEEGRDDGFYTKFWGWPLPIAVRDGQVFSTDPNIFCCGRDGGFTLEKLHRHPEVFLLPPWEFFWPGALVDMAIWLPVVAAFAFWFERKAIPCIYGQGKGTPSLAARP